MSTKSLMGWAAAAALALALTASTRSTACDQHAQAADAKDPNAAASGEQAGCDKPCCAKHAATEAHAATGTPPNANPNAANGVPCDGAKAADGKGCPKKAALVAKAGPAKDAPKDAPKAEPAPNAGANR